MAVHRKLSAIMFTDMQGYTAMMRKDESAALEVRKRHREAFKTITEQFHGTIIQYFGDGTLTVFESSVEAVNCALELQKAFRQKPIIPVRIGIHVGDIVIAEDDIIGDAVNIASRIENAGIPGGVYFSAQVNDQLRSHQQIKTMYVDVFHFKNVEEPIPVFALVDDSIEVPESKLAKSNVNESFWNRLRTNLSSKNGSPFKIVMVSVIAIVLLIGVYYFTKINGATIEKSFVNSISEDAIAVLPIQNISGNAKNDVLCESITDALLQQMASARAIRNVVPKSLINDYLRNSTPISKLARDLNARYILEGALHQSDSLFSMDLRLADPLQRTYLWSKRYEHISEDNYLQEIQSVVGQELVEIVQSHSERNLKVDSISMKIDNKDVQALLMKANTLTDQMDKESLYQALPLYEKVVQLEPNMAEGYMGLARVYVIGGLIWGIFNQQEAATKAKDNLQRSMALKTTLEASQYVLITKFFFDYDFDYVERNLPLIAILPPFPDGAFYSVYCNMVGRFGESIRYSEKYIKRYPNAGNGFAQLIRGHFLSGNIEKADSLMQKYDSEFKNDQFYMRDVAMVHLYRGNMDSFKEMNQTLKSNFLDTASVHLFYEAVALTYDGASSDKVQEPLELLRQKYEKGMAGSPAWFLAMYHFYIGDDTKAFDWLSKSFENKEVEITWLATEPLLESFRTSHDPRYMAIYNQMNWPDK